MSIANPITNTTTSTHGTIVCPLCNRRLFYQFMLMVPGRVKMSGLNWQNDPDNGMKLKCRTGMNRSWQCPECEGHVIVAWRLEYEDDESVEDEAVKPAGNELVELAETPPADKDAKHSVAVAAVDRPVFVKRQKKIDSKPAAKSRPTKHEAEQQKLTKANAWLWQSSDESSPEEKAKENDHDRRAQANVQLWQLTKPESDEESSDPSTKYEALDVTEVTIKLDEVPERKTLKRRWYNENQDQQEEVPAKTANETTEETTNETTWSDYKKRYGLNN